VTAHAPAPTTASSSARSTGVAVGVLVPPDVLALPHVPRAAYLADAAESGIDHLAVGDHVSFHVGIGFDGLVHATTLLAMQARLPVHVAVYLLALRHPVVVARMLSTISEIAPGRLTLGIGVGGEDRHEMEICGVDPGTRGRRTDEAMQALRALQTGEVVSFGGEHIAFERAQVLPAPSPAVPLVVGGRSDAAVRRAGRYGDGWLGIWVSAARYASVVAQVGEIAAEAGRADLPTDHQLNVWCGFGHDRAAAVAHLAPAMSTLYATPFDRFERYSPSGRPSQVAEALLPYVQAGCRSFNLIIPDPEPLRALDHAAHVRDILHHA
jgi:alkanesulfonate monooxygenase SsuD/methylene tetrahydromethanopterin reductase-like flavin-dependent oxidoreductase (luciferase family)